jgi:protein-disulfide isomerase
VGDACVATFQSASSRAVLWPERFRGGCAFGAGESEPSPDSSAGIIGETACEAPLAKSTRVRPDLALLRGQSGADHGTKTTMHFGRRQMLRLAGGALLAALPGAARAQSAANQWFAIQGDDGQPTPNLRAPVELIADLEELPGVIWGGGGPSPAVTLVEFYDYNCPWCRAAAADIAALMRGNRDLRVGLAQNAILSPQSMQAAKVHLALLQLKGAAAAYALHERLFATPGRIDGPRALEVAASLGADRAEIERIADGAQVGATLRKQMALASSFGLIATPSFVVGGAAVLGYPGPKSLERIVAETRRCGTITC